MVPTLFIIQEKAAMIALKGGKELRHANGKSGFKSQF